MSNEKITYEIEKLAFERYEDYKGFNIRAYYLKEPNQGDAIIRVFRDGRVIRQFLFPAYKIWNLAAHFDEIVESELAGNSKGYDDASWDGISGATVIFPDETEVDHEN